MNEIAKHTSAFKLLNNATIAEKCMPLKVNLITSGSIQYSFYTQLLSLP